jgi:hypothetical protein
MARSLHFLLVTLSVVLLLSGPAAAQGFGSRLLRTFFVFAEQPLSSSVAEANGWYRLSSTCDPNVGYAYAQTSGGPTSLSPVTLYAGQLSGTFLIYLTIYSLFVFIIYSSIYRNYLLGRFI